MMTRTGNYRVLASLMGLLAASLSLLVVGLGAQGLVCGLSWSTVASGEHILRPSAIDAISSNDIWVVGSTRKNAALVRTGAEHWDGSSWSRFPTPDVGTGENMLNGLNALASNYVWTVGYSTRSGLQRTLIEHWDGTQWRVVTSPNDESERHHLWRQYADERGCPEKHQRMGSRFLPHNYFPQEPHTAVERYLLDDGLEPQPGHFRQLVA